MLLLGVLEELFRLLEVNFVVLLVATLVQHGTTIVSLGCLGGRWGPGGIFAVLGLRAHIGPTPQSDRCVVQCWRQIVFCLGCAHSGACVVCA